MDGDQGAGDAGAQQEGDQQHPLALLYHRGDPLAQQSSQTSVSQSGGEGAQQQVSQGVGTVAVQAVDDKAHDNVQVQSGGKTGDHSCDQQGKDHVELEQTENTHDNNGQCDWITDDL